MPGSLHPAKRDISLSRYRTKKLKGFCLNFFDEHQNPSEAKIEELDANRLCPLYFEGKKITRNELLKEIATHSEEAKEFLICHLHQASYMYSTRLWLADKLGQTNWALKFNNSEDSELHFSWVNNQLRVTEVCRVNEAMPCGEVKGADFFLNHKKNVYLQETHRHSKGIDNIYKPQGGIACFETTYITSFPKNNNRSIKEIPRTILYDVSITRKDKTFCDLVFSDERKVFTIILDFFKAVFGKHISRCSAIPRPENTINQASELASQAMLRT